MKPNNIVSERRHAEQVSKNAVAMTMDEDSSVFMMDMLSTLYTYPAQAALREYLSNAQDAHISKGENLPPIQVSIPPVSDQPGFSSPTRLSENRTLSVRDFGNGMSEEEFSTILSRYGKSTKRDSNNLIGGFGLGAKAGFALSDEFFMTSYQNGQGLKVRIFKDGTNQGFVEVVERFQTSEPDGMLVEVLVPHANLREFGIRALHTFFWAYDSNNIVVKPANVNRLSLHNSQQFSSVEFGGNIVGWLGKQTEPTPSGYSPGGVTEYLYAAVGSVTYRLQMSRLMAMVKDSPASEGVLNYQSFFRRFHRLRVINLPIGSVDLPSSREEITLSERSIGTIMEILSRYLEAFHIQLQDEINDGTYLEAMMAVSYFENSYYPKADGFSWRGRKLGVDLLKSSKAFILDARGATGTMVNAASIETTSYFANTTSSGKSVVVIPVESDEEAGQVKKILAQQSLKTDGAISSLTRHVEEEGLTRGGFEHLEAKEPTYGAVEKKVAYFVMCKTDPMYEMFAEAPVLEVSTLHTIVDRVDEFRRMIEEIKEQEQLDALAAEEAKRLEEAAMVTSFLLGEDDRKQLARNQPAEVYGNTAEMQYYWSYEEVVEQLVSVEDTAPAFPYALPTYGNSEDLGLCVEDFYTYTVIEDMPRTNSYVDVFHINLRALLSSLLPQESRITILGSHINLDEFKAQHPAVGSAVGAVKALLGEALSNENSKFSILRSLLANQVPNKEEIPRTLEIFDEVISPVQRDALSAEFRKIIEQNKEVGVSPRVKGVNTRHMERLLSLFIEDAPQPRKTLNEGAIEAKYPLLFNARSFDSPAVVQDMIAYINSKG